MPGRRATFQIVCHRDDQQLELDFRLIVLRRQGQRSRDRISAEGRPKARARSSTKLNIFKHFYTPGVTDFLALIGWSVKRMGVGGL